ncbi:MAG: hypothetical protein ACI9LN_004036, partial [Saprospiraceae bacterium]
MVDEKLKDYEPKIIEPTEIKTTGLGYLPFVYF